jgi:hypothetical protein
MAVMGRGLVKREVRLRGASSRDESVGDMMGLGKSPIGKSMCLIVLDPRTSGKRAGKHWMIFGVALDHVCSCGCAEEAAEEVE